jgi:LuxR family maltose regulon positive regulatory protein
MVGDTVGDPVATGSTSVPVVPVDTLRRDPLLDRLDVAVQRPLTLITAPAGYGKSTLVAQWCHERGPGLLAWRTLDAPDDEDRVRAALTDSVEHVTGRRLPPLREGGDGTGRLDGDAHDALARTLAGVEECVVVVDNVSLDGDSGLWTGLAAAIASAPSCGLRLVVVSRSRPDASVVALRLHGVVEHLDELDLALTSAETTDYLHRSTAADLPDDLADSIAERLEGWIAGAAVMTMALDQTSDPDALEGHIAVGYELIDAYLRAEVIDRIPHELREFAVAVSCLDTMDGAVCDAVTGGHDGHSALDALRARGLFLTPAADGTGWLRFHELFRRALDRQSARFDSADQASRLRRAADWLTEREMLVPAARCFVRLRDWEALNNLVRATQRTLLRGQPPRELLELLDQVPAQYHRDHYPEAIAHAGLDMWAGRVSAARDTLERIEDHVPRTGRVAIEMAASGAVSWVEEVEYCLAAAERGIALAADIDDSEFLYGTGDTYRHACHTTALLAAVYLGDWHRATPHTVEIPAEVIGSSDPLYVVRMLGRRATYFALAGETVPARAEAQATLTVAERGTIDPMFSADAHYALGECLRSMGRADEAHDELARSLELARPNDRRNLIASAVASTALAHVDAGNPGRALAVIDDLRSVTSHRNPATIDGMMRAAEARAHTLLGETRLASAALRGAPDTSVVASARVALALHTGDDATARDVVARWPEEPTVGSRLRQATAHAVLLRNRRQQSESRKTIRAVLEAASTHELVQPLADLGEPVVAVLRDARSARLDPRATAIADRALAALAVSGAGAGALTPREAAVLARLDTGLTLPQLAAEMYLSVNTLKTHTRSIYRKLGVSSRDEAVRIWRETHAGGGT